MVKSFKEYFLEKVSINSEWFILKLPSGAEINASIKLISQNKIEVASSKDSRAKEISLGANTKESIHNIEKEIGEKLDLESSDIKKLLQLIGDCGIKG